MSWLTNAVKAVGKGVKDTGHFVGKVASNPITQGITAAALAATGVGAPASAAILAGMKGGGNLLKPGGNLKGAATGALQGGALGAVSGLASPLVRAIPGVSKVGDFIHGITGLGKGPTGAEIGGGSSDPGSYGADGDGYGGGSSGGTQQSLLGEINDFAKSHVPGLSGIEGFLKGHGGDALGSLGGFVTGNGGMNALGIAQGINAAGLQNKADNYAKQAVGGVQDSYNQRAPLRAAGVQSMLNPQTNDLSGLTANSGVYGRGLPKIAPARGFAS